MYTYPFTKCLSILLLASLLATFGRAQNVAPTANNDSYTIGFNRVLNVNALRGVLNNDTDPNTGTAFTVNSTPVTSPTSGALILNTDGSFQYTPNTGFTGADGFVYQMCDDGTPNTILSRFDFDSLPLSAATIGPDATSINPNAAQIDCGIHIPPGQNGNTVGLDLVIPNAGGLFEFTSFSIDFEYRDQEGIADLFTAGNFRIWHSGSDTMSIQISVINGTTGLPQTYTQVLGNFLAGNIAYNISYEELTGTIVYTANGTPTTFTVAPPFSPMNTALASDVNVGLLMDNAGTNLPSFCSIQLTDTSVLCDTASVNLNVIATVLTNRNLTFRVNPN